MSDDVFKSWDHRQWPKGVPRERYEVTATKRTASYSGRTLFKVRCKRCKSVLTPATTAPDQIVKHHEQDMKNHA